MEAMARGTVVLERQSSRIATVNDISRESEEAPQVSPKQNSRFKGAGRGINDCEVRNRRAGILYVTYVPFRCLFISLHTSLTQWLKATLLYRKCSSAIP